ncbi:MAG: hypothetical protein OEY45_03750 [Gammaproteobacteria bacterium]|nr:hypothetical protein [Gammaproteobacteria bacterium]MDH5514253.1 hypothetical protein [Gammaproteobacteria bacterium]
MMISNHNSLSWRAVLHWMLVLSLLLGQSLVLGHDHDTGQDADNACALCLFAQQSDNITPSIADGLPVQACCNHFGHALRQYVVTVTVPPFQSRAPPSISC